MTHTVAHEVWGYENESHDTRDAWGILRHAEAHAADASGKASDVLMAVQGLESPDLSGVLAAVAAVDAKVDEALGALAGSAQREAQMIDLIGQLDTGAVDAVAVVDGIRQLLHQATAPHGDGDGGGGDPL